MLWEQETALKVPSSVLFLLCKRRLLNVPEVMSLPIGAACHFVSASRARRPLRTGCSKPLSINRKHTKAPFHLETQRAPSSLRCKIASEASSPRFLWTRKPLLQFLKDGPGTSRLVKGETFQGKTGYFFLILTLLICSDATTKHQRLAGLQTFISHSFGA